MAPGTYRAQLRAYADTKSHLTFGVALGALTPDGIESNDAFGLPAVPADGECEVNLHAATDVDHDKFVVPNDLESFAATFALVFERSDYPATRKRTGSSCAATHAPRRSGPSRRACPSSSSKPDETSFPAVGSSLFVETTTP